MPRYIQNGNPFLEAANYGSAAGNSIADAMLKLPLQRMALARQAQQDAMEQQRMQQMDAYRRDQLAREQKRDEATAKYRQDEVAQRQAHDKMEQRRYDADRLTRANADRQKAKQGDIKAAQYRQDSKRRQSETDARITKIQAETDKLKNPPAPPLMPPSIATELLNPEKSPLTGEARTNLGNIYYMNATQPRGSILPQVGFLQPHQDAVPAPSMAAPPSIGLTAGQPQGMVEKIPTTTGVTNTFPTPDHVKAAVKSGQLSPEQATQILQQQFGFTP